MKNNGTPTTNSTIKATNEFSKIENMIGVNVNDQPMNIQNIVELMFSENNLAPHFAHTTSFFHS